MICSKYAAACSNQSFLVACTRLYKPLCRSVGRSVAECSEHATYGDWPCFPGVYTDINHGYVSWLRGSGAWLRGSGAWQRGSGGAREWRFAGVAMWGNGGAWELGAWEVGVHRSGGAWEWRFMGVAVHWMGGA